MDSSDDPTRGPGAPPSSNFRKTIHNYQNLAPRPLYNDGVRLTGSTVERGQACLTEMDNAVKNMYHRHTYKHGPSINVWP